MPSHSLREKEFALQNDGFITKLLKPELPCTPTRQSSPVRTRFEPKAHRVSTGTPSELGASFYMEQGTALAARNEFGMRLDSDTLQLTPLCSELVHPWSLGCSTWLGYRVTLVWEVWWWNHHFTKPILSLNDYGSPRGWIRLTLTYWFEHENIHCFWFAILSENLKEFCMQYIQKALIPTSYS